MFVVPSRVPEGVAAAWACGAGAVRAVRARTITDSVPTAAWPGRFLSIRKLPVMTQNDLGVRLYGREPARPGACTAEKLTPRRAPSFVGYSSGRS